MQSCDGVEREQVELWENITERELSGAAYIFDIVWIMALPKQVPLQQSSSQKAHGPVVLEDEQPKMCLFRGIAASEEMVLDSARGHIFDIALRPLPHGLPIVHNRWRTIIFPHVPQRGKGMISINWKLCNMSQGDLSRVPGYCIDKSASDGSGLDHLDQQLVLQILRFLRMFASGDGLEEGQPGQLHKVVQTARTPERLHREFDPLCFKKARLCPEHCANFGGVVAGIEQQIYRVTFLLKVPCMADLLRTTSDLRDVLLQASRWSC